MVKISHPLWSVGNASMAETEWSSARNVLVDTKSMPESNLHTDCTTGSYGQRKYYWHIGSRCAICNTWQMYNSMLVFLCVERTVAVGNKSGTLTEYFSFLLCVFMFFSSLKVFPTMMLSLLWRCASVLLGLSCCLMGVTSSLNLEDPNVCSHWERYLITILHSHPPIGQNIDFNVTHI